MPTKLLLVETPSFAIPANILPGEKRCNQSNWKEALEVCLADAATPTVVILPFELKRDPLLASALAGEKGSLSVATFSRAEDLAKFADSIKFLFGENRSTGVKDCLAKGSTIYSESFFNPANVGGKLDPSYNFVRKQLNAGNALEALGSLQSLLFLGLQSLPGHGEGGTGERVDVQIGADDQSVVLTVRFDLDATKISEFRINPLLDLPRSSADIIEVRYLKDAGKVEILCWFAKKQSTDWTIEVHSFHQSTGIENKDAVKEYSFQTFGSLTQSAPEEKRVVKGGFKKKFSEKVSVKAGGEKTDNSSTTISADAQSPEELTRIKGGEAQGSAPKLTISGNANLSKKEETLTVGGEPIANREKSQSLLEGKIQGLEVALKQRDELVAKLNKEIEEIKDPMKMGVISGIKDNQLDGLKGNIVRLESELTEAQAREKELMAVVDKAIQLKDDAVKKYKEVETKLKSAQGGNNSKVVMLEKQLDEKVRQNKEMSKRITQLTEQITASGKKVA